MLLLASSSTIHPKQKGQSLVSHTGDEGWAGGCGEENEDIQGNAITSRTNALWYTYSMEEIKKDDSMDDDIIPYAQAIRMLFTTKNTFQSLVRDNKIPPPFKYKDSKNSKLYYRKSWIRDFLKKRQQAKSSKDEIAYSFHAIVKK